MFYESFMSWWGAVGPTAAILFIFGSFVLFLLSVITPNVWYSWIVWGIGLTLLIFAFIFAPIHGIIWGLIVFIGAVSWVFLVVLSAMRLWAYTRGEYNDDGLCERPPYGGNNCNDNGCNNDGYNGDRPVPLFEPIRRMFMQKDDEPLQRKSARENFFSQSAGDSYIN